MTPSPAPRPSSVSVPSVALASTNPGAPAPDASEDCAATGTPQRRVRPPRLAVLDGLRLIAALMVVCWHFVAQGDLPWQAETRSIFGAADGATSYGWLGVQLFFVISGFVICMSAWGRPLGDFVVSRVVRLYPAYWFAILAITLTVTIWPVLQPRMTSSEILVNLTMLQYPLGVPGVSAVFWTLWNELHFYILFGLCVVWRGTTYRRVLAFCGLWTIASVFAAAVRDPIVTTLVDERYSPFFIGGVLIYLMYRFRPTLLLWGMLGTSWALALLKTVTLTREAKTFVGYPVDWKPAAFIVTAAFGGVAAVTLLPRLARIQSRWLTVAGAMTYPLYLLHLEIGWLLIRVLHRHVPVVPLTIGMIATMLLLSYAVHRFVERPLAPRLRRAMAAAMADLRDPEAAERRPVGAPARQRAGALGGAGDDAGPGGAGDRGDAGLQPAAPDRMRIRRVMRLRQNPEARRPATAGQRSNHP